MRRGRGTLPYQAALSLLVLLAGCAGQQAAEEVPERAVARETIIETALGQIGRPYRYGGDDPSGFDCSGLVEYSYRSAGFSVPHNTAQLRDAGRRIALRDARPGDLLLYRFSDKPDPSLHVSIYLGDGRMVHAPASGREVQVVPIEQAPWPGRFITAIRMLR